MRQQVRLSISQPCQIHPLQHVQGMLAFQRNIAADTPALDYYKKAAALLKQ